MRIPMAVALTLVFAVPSSALDKNKIFSGPQVGETIAAFDVLQVTGSKTAKVVRIAKPDQKGVEL